VYEDYEGNQYFSSEYPDNPFLEGYLTLPQRLEEKRLYTLDKKGPNGVARVKEPARKVIKKIKKKPFHYSNERWYMGEGGWDEEHSAQLNRELQFWEDWESSLKHYDENLSPRDYVS